MNGTDEPGEPLPRWFWLLPLLAAAAWWRPFAYWASDDFLALHYAQDLSRALADFDGPQYGATDTWFFFRPLVTLRWWLDAALAGGAPWLAHAGNLMAHAASALLVGLLWRRALPPVAAFGAGVWWALLPSHAGTVGWAAGRTDGTATPLLLLSLWLLLRWREGRQRTRWPSLLAFAAALLAKEVAFAGLPLAFLLPAMVAVPGARTPSLRQRLRDGLHAGWPFVPVFAALFAWRWHALGRLGGYDGARYDAVAIADGLWHTTADLLVPARWTSIWRLPLPAVEAWLPWVAAAPLLWIAGTWLRRAPRLFLGSWLLFLVACAPMAGFLAGYDLPFNLRYYYLPTVALAGLLAGAGPVPYLLALLGLLLPFAAEGEDLRRADAEDAAIHRGLLQELQDGAAGPVFVAGMPFDNGHGTAIQLHYGTDRMLEPPFGPGGVRLFALRPASSTPLAHALGDFRETGDKLPFALPAGTTVFFHHQAGIRGRALPEALPALPLQLDGGADFGFDRLLALAKADGEPGALRPVLRTVGVSPPAYRLTFLTATGYFCVPFPNQAPQQQDGEVRLRDLFHYGRWAGPGPLSRLADPATAGQEPRDSYLLDGLCIATTHDLRTDFPVLVEALGADPTTPGELRVTHRARTLLWLAFDRRLPAFVRLLKGQR